MLSCQHVSVPLSPTVVLAVHKNLSFLKRPQVLIIDAGLGNLGSVCASFRRLDCDLLLLSRPPSPTAAFTHVVLPGVGSFAAGAHQLSCTGWDQWIINTAAHHDIPILGICLGMQLLSDRGSEGLTSGHTAGLGLIPGTVERFVLPSSFRLPHVGWNSLKIKKPSPLFNAISSGADFYFVHSYRYHLDSPSHILAETSYYSDFPSVICRDSVYGIQAHPEKSQRAGVTFLSNFLLVN